MSEKELKNRLTDMGEWRPGLELEPFEWLAAQAPAGALDDLDAYRLIDPEATPVRDARSRNWRPVLAAGDEVLIGPTPEMLDRLLAVSGYFERPEVFGRTLLLQFHRFALDFYQGYEVREESFEQDGGELVVRGQATKGAGHNLRSVAFETRAGRGKAAAFTPKAEEDLWG